MTQEAPDPNLAPNQAAIVVTQGEGNDFTFGAFFGSEIKQDSIAFNVTSELLKVLFAAYKDAIPLPDIEAAMTPGADQPKEGS